MSGRPPAFEPRRTLDSAWQWLAPDVRLGDSTVDAEWSERLTVLIREQAQTQGFDVYRVVSPQADALRQRVLALISAKQAQSRGLLAAGTPVEPPPPARTDGPERLSGTVVVARLAGFTGGDDRPAPMPPDVTIPDPQNRPDYVVPSAPRSGSSSLVLELVIVDADQGEVTLHRRVAIPNDHSRRWSDAVQSLVRQLLRGLTPQRSQI